MLIFRSNGRTRNSVETDERPASANDPAESQMRLNLVDPNTRRDYRMKDARVILKWNVIESAADVGEHGREHSIANGESTDLSW
jgi:hypothetical protein